MEYCEVSVIIFCLIQLIERARTCRSGHIEFNSSCYRFVDKEYSWEHAQDYCTNEGGYLAEINHPSENAFLQLEATKRLGSNSGSFGYWIGGLCKEIQRIWIWDSTGNIIDNTYWGPNEPNYVEELCISLHQPLGFLWNDCRCDEKLRYICEGGLCLNGSVEFNSSCYTFVDNEPKSWPEAKVSCRNAGGYLAEVTSTEENSFLVKEALDRSIWVYIFNTYGRTSTERSKSDKIIETRSKQFTLKVRGMYSIGLRHIAYWIGGLSKKMKRIWTWDRENTVIVDSYWAPNEPDNFRQRCIMLWKTLNFLWVDYFCGTEFFFVCEGERHFETTKITQSTQALSTYHSISSEVINTELEKDDLTYAQHTTIKPVREKSTAGQYITAKSVTEDSIYDPHTTTKPATETSTTGQSEGIKSAPEKSVFELHRTTKPAKSITDHITATKAVKEDSTNDPHTTTKPATEKSTTGQITATKPLTEHSPSDPQTTTKPATVKAKDVQYPTTTISDTEDKTYSQVTSKRETAIVCQNTTAICSCATHKSMEELQAEIKKLKLALIINKNTTSKYWRSITSAADNRVSAQSLGHTGAVVLLLVISAIIVMDVERIVQCRSTSSCRKKKKRNNCS